MISASGPRVPPDPAIPSLSMDAFGSLPVYRRGRIGTSGELPSPREWTTSTAILAQVLHDGACRLRGSSLGLWVASIPCGLGGPTEHSSNIDHTPASVIPSREKPYRGNLGRVLLMASYFAVQTARQGTRFGGELRSPARRKGQMRPPYGGRRWTDSIHT